MRVAPGTAEELIMMVWGVAVLALIGSFFIKDKRQHLTLALASGFVVVALPLTLFFLAPGLIGGTPSAEDLLPPPSNTQELN